jgi:5-formyltetrahydrofolate cyclo-ligase
MSLAEQRRRLRRELRRRRAALSSDVRSHHSDRLVRHLALAHELRGSRRIALYLPNDAEIDPTGLFERPLRPGRRLYLPVLRPGPNARLWFARYEPGERLVLNRFSIPEPVARGRRLTRPLDLDLVLVPLVGFDRHGHRLGMGGGFYDRSFSFLRHRTRGWHRPVLIGTAFACQQIDEIPPEPWDVPLDAVATEDGIRWFGKAGVGR